MTDLIITLPCWKFLFPIDPMLIAWIKLIQSRIINNVSDGNVFFLW